MQLAVIGLLIALGASLLVLSPATPTQAAPDFEQRVIELVNTTRAQNGLTPLKASPQLMSSAHKYSAYMSAARFFGHTAPDGSNLVSRNEAAGYRDWVDLAENLAGGQPDPESVVKAWMSSPTHRANILSPRVKEIGVGYVFVPGSQYGHYWTQEFGNRAGAPRPAPSSRDGYRAPAPAPQPLWVCQQTGHSIGADWLAFVQAHGGIDNFGYPRTEVISDPISSGQTVQYFQRLIVEWHPNNPAGYQFQRRLLGDALYPGCDPAVSPYDAPPGPSQYFPYSPDRPTGLGHFVADYTRSGQPVYFKEYFDAHGGVDMFGYPKEEPAFRGGIWTQRFQAAVFQYHPENDKPGFIPGTNIPYRAYRVQLELLGDEYIGMKGLPFK
jgi:hypothetical protein